MNAIWGRKMVIQGKRTKTAKDSGNRAFTDIDHFQKKQNKFGLLVR
ncbi:hypothetical protein [Endozoicomonas sp. Mp262]